MYQKEVNSLKNDSKLKSMKYLVKILFYLDKLVVFPSCKITGVWQSIIAQWLFFVSQAKMQLHQVNENQNRFETNLAVTSSCEVTMSLHEVKGQFLCMCNLQLRFDLYQKIPTSCIFIVTSEGHTCPGTDLWPHAYSSWPHRLMANLQINFKAVLIFNELAQLHFSLAYKNSHWAIIGCHTPVILQLGKKRY